MPALLHFSGGTSPEPERPEEAIQRVVEIIRRLQDRTRIMQELEAADAPLKAEFEERAQAERDAVATVARTTRFTPNVAEYVAEIDALLDERETAIAARRREYEILTDMVRGVAAKVAPSLGHSEQWLLGALGYAIRPQARRLQQMVDLNFELESLAEELDPSSGPAGDIIQSPEEVIDWLDRAAKA